jgi:hypothetical protein
MFFMSNLIVTLRTICFVVSSVSGCEHLNAPSLFRSNDISPVDRSTNLIERRNIVNASACANNFKKLIAKKDPLHFRLASRVVGSGSLMHRVSVMRPRDSRGSAPCVYAAQWRSCQRPSVICHRNAACAVAYQAENSTLSLSIACTGMRIRANESGIACQAYSKLNTYLTSSILCSSCCHRWSVVPKCGHNLTNNIVFCPLSQTCFVIFMKQRPSWKAGVRLSRRETLHLLWNTTDHCRIHKSPALGPIYIQSDHNPRPCTLLL